MLRMALEREIIIDIRNRITAAENRLLFVAETTQSTEPTQDAFPRVRLGSRQGSTVVGVYAHTVEKEVGLSRFDFINLLAKFLREHAGIDIHGNDFDGDGFEGDQLDLRNCRVSELKTGQLGLNY
jgi:hypothetical protein